MKEDRLFLRERLEAATSAAREAGALLLESLGRDHRVEYKGAINIVTETDRASEELLLERLSRRFPDHSIVTEESGGYQGSSPYSWIVDPLDGTTNFAHGFPFFCVSIALAREGRSLLGCVFDPVRGELFTAVSGQGARLDGRPVRVSRVSELEFSLLATGFPYDIREGKETNLDLFAAFAVRAQAIRRAGSAALDLAYTACGRFEGYWELNLKSWDMAAGALMVSEAGGRVTGLAGEGHDTFSASVVASNGLIHDRMLEVIALVRAESAG